MYRPIKTAVVIFLPAIVLACISLLAHFKEARSNEFPAQLPPTPLSTTVTGAVVRAILFTTQDCRNCQIEDQAALSPVLTIYGRRFEYRTIDIVNSDDVEYLYQVAESYGISRGDVDLPLIIVGDYVLIGEQMAAQLPDLVALYLKAGGVDWPFLPPRKNTDFHPKTDEGVSSADTSGDFTPAFIVMAFMMAALVYCVIAFIIGRIFSPPFWADRLIPILIIIGICVAGCLSYIEIRSAKAVCGFVGDCNSVLEHGRYVRLFDILPVSLFGLMGYTLLLASWLVRRCIPKFQKLAAIGFFGMAFFAVIFSFYLTFLEAFVIKALCLWCLCSSIIVTLLLVLGSPPAIHQFAETICEE